MNYLGPTREHIAEHKAGIVKPDSMLVLSERDEALHHLFIDRTQAPVYIAGRDFDVSDNRVAVGGRLVDLRTPGGTYDDVFIGLHGAHQAANAATALMAAEAFFGQALSEDAVRQGFAAASSPGRLEVVNRRPLTVLDGAHNVSGAETLRRALDEEFAVDGRRIFVIGMLDPHEPKEMLEALEADKARLIIATQPDSPRALAPEAIAGAAKTLGVPAVVIERPDEAVKEAIATAVEDDLIVVTGSLYTVGAARKELLDS
jgi:dihydrofolate synthase/folylpolyglutamate synthase